ncbi:MAG: hypothetical protein H0W48_06540 [Methylibium sp.]|uniref:hypothetical protein n=1 Tax=Methylibium sp. TaxID=2067992 RepID=UPI00179904E6|nr:hypothetical protein [Methylibium sp.]MBA2721790.1 hypothetical protein [Methylibium sp.]MBA3590329.1 hypothetical protein [Methylibium sp.]MBA3624097.1 hypothetical protein [Methylibium sp.]
MKRAGKPPPPAASPDAATSDRKGKRPDAAESVAGEEDPGSALEQFSDLMHDAPAQGGEADNPAAAQSQGTEPRRRRSDDDEPLPEPGPDRPA